MIPVGLELGDPGEVQGGIPGIDVAFPPPTEDIELRWLSMLAWATHPVEG